ncbi:tRNA dihydrouridine synthase DusB [Rhodoblastus sphagnicola]|uniref:tRNA-dihydrouridine synthase n=1 Tax=Rhodoblastus sphagnicola TaxID=333368 RepID=A0A2S6N1Y7_9HYPH|nr:tRNA dihydrouridine synthase DusB [Rhodoblastus sphagnicola]MBB4198284.1 nifR3 family TIM-barrel protein [Rhodoblastus sphagnicola]PPQ28631.1 tRNA dihydrouridine synthase DusB [Rhodoblastus sphagnicola]
MDNFAQQTCSVISDVWRVGGLTLDGRAMLAPMAGITDLAMRRLARRFGAALAFSEMVAADASGRDRRESLLRLRGEGVSPHAAQIAGCDPADMAQAARRAEQAGADLIDINMGCPARRVTGGAAGSALMRDLDLAQALIAATVRATKIPVSVKMRLGWDRDALNAPELARRAEGEGAVMVTVHGRTRNQFYKGEADWAAIRATVEAVKIPVVANGDCRNAADARRMLELSGARAVMIGRAALGQPWLVGDIAHELAHGEARQKLPAATRRAAALEHFAGLLDIFGEAHGLRHARKHLAAYADQAARENFFVDPRARRRLVESDDAREVEALLQDLYDTPRKEAA